MGEDQGRVPVEARSARPAWRVAGPAGCLNAAAIDEVVEDAEKDLRLERRGARLLEETRFDELANLLEPEIAPDFQPGVAAVVGLAGEHKAFKEPLRRPVEEDDLLARAAASVEEVEKGGCAGRAALLVEENPKLEIDLLEGWVLDDVNLGGARRVGFGMSVSVSHDISIGTSARKGRGPIV